MNAINPTSVGLTSRDHLWTAIITLVSIVVLSPGLFWGLPFGVSIMGASRVLDGDVPYRDFWTMYAPGQFYFTAGLFWLFGRHVLVQGIAAVVLHGLVAGMLFRLVRRLEVPRLVAILVASVFVGSLWSTSPELTSYNPILLLILIALERVVAYLQHKNRRCLLMAGAMLGLAAWFKHDVAAYVTLSVVVALFVMWLTTRKLTSKSDRYSLLAMLDLVAASLTVALPVMMFLAWSAPTDAWHNLIVFPATDFRGVRREAYPSIVPNWAVFQSWVVDLSNVYKLRDGLGHLRSWILCQMPQLVFIVGLCVMLMTSRRVAHKTRAVVAIWLVFLFLFWSAAHVQQNTHLYSMAIASLCLGAMAWHASDGMRTKRRMVRAGLIACLGVYTIGLMITPVMQLAQVIKNWPDSQQLAIAGARGIRVSGDDYNAYQSIVDFIHNNVAPDERIYVGLARHDATVIGNMRFYYLSRRRNACRYDELHPGVTDRLDVQREMIDAIESHQVRCVVLWNFGWNKHKLDTIRDRNAAAVKGAGADLLDRFITATFDSVAQYGQYTLMWRKGMSYRLDEM